MPAIRKTFVHLAPENYPFLDRVANGEIDRFDNSDGVVMAEGLGPYSPAPGGREMSQGAYNPKGMGAASGRGQTMRVKGGSR